jgi:hypothetical protein
MPRSDEQVDETPTNYAGQVASQETEIRELAAVEKPHESTVAQVEEIAPFGEAA